MRFPKVLSALVVGVGLASAGHAQEQGRASIKSTDSSPRVFVIFVDSRPDELETEADDWTYRRRAETASAEESYLDASDPMLAGILDDPEQPSFGLNLELDIGPDGQVSRCEADDRYPDRAKQAAAFCPMLTKNLVYLPALDLEWKPIADRVTFLIQPSHEWIQKDRTLPAIANFSAMTAVKAPSFSNFRKAWSWPPQSDYAYSIDTPRFAKQPERGIGGAQLPAGEFVAGIALFAEDTGSTGCEVVIQSGNQPFDEAACAFVMKQAGPSYSRSSGGGGFPMLVTGRSKPERIIAPGDKLALWLRLPEGTVDTFFGGFVLGLREAGGDPARLQLNLKVDGTGKVRDCRVDASSGIAAADIWACEFVLRELQYEAAIDAFGRIRDDLEIWWRVPTGQQ